MRDHSKHQAVLLKSFAGPAFSVLMSTHSLCSETEQDVIVKIACWGCPRGLDLPSGRRRL